MFKSARDRHRIRQLKYRTPISELLVTGGPVCLTFNEYINSQSTAPHQHLRNTCDPTVVPSTASRWRLSRPFAATHDSKQL
jgi:hypothetical protein